MSRRLWAWCAVLVATLVSSQVASAHPASRDKYSLRTAIRLSDDGLDVVVVLEVPMQIVTGALKERLKSTEGVTDRRAAAQKVVTTYAEEQWADMAKGLALTMNGKPLAGSWEPRDDRYNGKGAVSEGFFLYIMEFRPQGTVSVGTDVTFAVHDEIYPDVPMVYSAWVIAGKGWDVASDSSAALMPDGPYLINSPAFWVEDPALRHLEVRYVKAP